MNRIAHFILGLAVILTACRTDDAADYGRNPDNGIVFKLQYDGYDNETTRSATLRDADYDRVEFCVVDGSGTVVDNMKGLYDPYLSEIRIEGLHEGEYRLLVLGVRGDDSRDGVTIRSISHVDDEWLKFPSDIDRPLEAEYFYSQTPFSVITGNGAWGNEVTAVIDGEVIQRRIIGRTDFSFEFNNIYVETALSTNEVELDSPRFRTGFTAGGEFTGRSNGESFTVDLLEGTSHMFPPTVDSEALRGEITVTTRNYRGTDIRRTYGFTLDDVSPNRIGTVSTNIVHPDDESAVAFVTERTFDKTGISFILQDDEPKEVYTDAAQRSFNTSAPLQVSVTEEGRLHVRFYSPRELSGVLVQARIPAVGNEFFDIAWFDRIPAFADFYGELPLAVRKSFCRTESGRIIETEPLDISEFAAAEFRMTSDDPFWAKLEAIEHGWKIAFSLYGGDPEAPDGGPVGNWMGIRPVHCREAVALFLNFTYMIDMEEHEEILRANEDRLYGNGGVNDKVTAETVLRQMRQPRTLYVGLVYPGNGVIGLGGGTAFGAYQQAWFHHYTNTYSCEIMFHELGHVMGYSHSSSFTYGPWAQELMNHFYVDHISEMPIDSPTYLNSSQNPHRYQ